MARTHSTLAGARLVLFLGLLLASPAGFAATAVCSARAVHAGDSIPATKLANWEPVDEQAVLVWTVHDSRAHLLRLAHPIPGLRAAAMILLATRGNDPTIRACGHDELLVPGVGTALIVSVQYLSEKRTAALDRGAASPIRATFT